jgi:hypothetical protein
VPIYHFIWDDTEQGNVAHLAEHGVSPDEAEHVVQNPSGLETNRSGNPIAFGLTPAGRHLAVPYLVLDDAETLIYIATAYDTPPRPRS